MDFVLVAACVSNTQDPTAATVGWSFLFGESDNTTKGRNKMTKQQNGKMKRRQNNQATKRINCL